MFEIKWLLIPIILSLIFTPLVIRLATILRVGDLPEKRKVHTQVMPRMGGVAFYLSFMLTATLFIHPDRQINAIFIGAFIVFISGVIDDMYNLSARYKLLFQIVGASIVVFYGNISLDTMHLPFSVTLNFGLVGYFLAVIWIIGITNAINLIDGLDGLSTGVSAIVLTTFAILSSFEGRYDIMMLSIMLAGSCFGFLPYNFHPAKIFAGDAGALFLGFMIGSLSLLGFKSSVLITLGTPLLILIVPIMDTLIAIIRRTLQNKKITDPDREHLHHTLFYKLNLSHRASVIVIYLTTITFSLIAYMYYVDRRKAFILLIIALIVVEIFIEYTHMISKKYRPLLSLVNRIFRKRS